MHKVSAVNVTSNGKLEGIVQRAGGWEWMRSRLGFPGWLAASG